MGRCIKCYFKGGPLNGQTRDLPDYACASRCTFNSGRWLNDTYDNGIVQQKIKRNRELASTWAGLELMVYTKGSFDADGLLIYEFDTLVMTPRCIHFMLKQNRRCVHLADSGGFCSFHVKLSKNY